MPDVIEQVIETPDHLARCCKRLGGHSVIGLDTEFIGENTFHPQLCLVQISTADELYLIDPLTCGPLDSLWEVLSDPKRIVVVHAGREEIRIARKACGQVPAGLFDVQIAAGLVGIGYPMGHAALVQHLVGVSLSKGETLTDWSRRPLTSSQIQYAFDDVRYLLRLHRKLADRLQRLGRADWAVEEFQSLVRRALCEDPEVERWRKLKGLGSLDRRKLAIVRELFDWRESVAERQNRPSRTVLRDDLIVELARRNPRTERDLSVLRGLPNRDLPAIFAAIERGRATGGDNLPAASERDNDPPQIGLVTNFLNALMADYCVRSKITPGLVSTTYDVKTIVRAHALGEPLPDDSALVRGWRAQFALPKLIDLLNGKQSVRIGQVGRPAPFTWDGINDSPAQAEDCDPQP